MFAAILLVAVLLAVAPLAAYLPLAVMAGLLFVVAWGLIDFAAMRRIFRASRGDALVLAVKPQTLDAAAPQIAPLVGPRTLVVSIMAGKTIAEIADANGSSAQKVIDADDEVDDLHEGVYDVIFGKMRETPEFIEQLMHLMSVSRQLERIADHAVNIAEDVMYTSGGEIVRHRKKNSAPAQS